MCRTTGSSLMTIQQGFMTTVYAQTMWISWSGDTTLIPLEQLYYGATAAAHLYSGAIVRFYIFQRHGIIGIAGKSPPRGMSQLQRADRAPAQHFKHSSPEKNSVADRCQGCLSENNRKRRETAERNKCCLSRCCLLNVEAWKSECQTRQKSSVRLLKQSPWIPLESMESKTSIQRLSAWCFHADAQC